MIFPPLQLSPDAYTVYIIYIHEAQTRTHSRNLKTNRRKFRGSNSHTYLCTCSTAPTPSHTCNTPHHRLRAPAYTVYMQVCQSSPNTTPPQHSPPPPRNTVYIYAGVPEYTLVPDTFALHYNFPEPAGRKKNSGNRDLPSRSWVVRLKWPSCQRVKSLCYCHTVTPIRVHKICILCCIVKFQS